MLLPGSCCWQNVSAPGVDPACRATFPWTRASRRRNRFLRWSRPSNRCSSALRTFPTGAEAADTRDDQSSMPAPDSNRAHLAAAGSHLAASGRVCRARLHRALPGGDACGISLVDIPEVSHAAQGHAPRTLPRLSPSPAVGIRQALRPLLAASLAVSLLLPQPGAPPRVGGGAVGSPFAFPSEARADEPASYHPGFRTMGIWIPERANA